MATTRTKTKLRRPSLAERLASGVAAPRVRRDAFLAYFAFVALVGGGSRADILSLILLRPLAVVFGAFALAAMPPGHLRSVRPLLWLMVAAAVAIGWQLVPLPPTWWQGLPGRAEIAALDAALGLDGLWRPASLSPAASWNALFSLVVPAAGLLLYAALDPADRRLALPAIAVFAVASAAIGLLQLLGSATGPLYFYKITNPGLPVGLFSNRNHQAVFLAAALPVLALWLRYSAVRARWVKPAGFAAGTLIVFVVLLTASRAGLAVAVPAAIVSAFVLAGMKQGGKPGARPAEQAPWRRWAGPGAAAVAGVAFLAYILVGHSAVLDRIVQTEPGEELRYRALPTIIDLAHQFWVAGAGAGTFAAAYQRVEPTTLLSANYLNHAHNDWLQLPIELGLAGLAVLAGFLFVLARSLRFRLSAMRRAGEGWPLAAVVAVPAIVAAASVVDYPLRTPSLALVAMVFLAALADPHTSAFRSRGGTGNRRPA